MPDEHPIHRPTVTEAAAREVSDALRRLRLAEREEREAVARYYEATAARKALSREAAELNIAHADIVASGGYANHAELEAVLNNH